MKKATVFRENVVVRKRKERVEMRVMKVTPMQIVWQLTNMLYEDTIFEKLLNCFVKKFC